MERKVVIEPRDFVGGAPMEAREGVRDIEVIYPETGFPARTSIMGEVEIDPGRRSPLHRHNREEVCFVVIGGIMFVGLLPRWPTPSPYEILEGEDGT